MPPMPGSIARGRYLRELKRIANTTSTDGLKAIREQLLAGVQHVDNFRGLLVPTENSLGEAELGHLARHWFGEKVNGLQAASSERWWADQATSDIIRYGEIRGIDMIIEAKEANKATCADCLWICRGETVEVVNTKVEFEDKVFITFMILTPPLPRTQQLADAGANYSIGEQIWVTTARENVTYEGRLLPGFRQDGKQPPNEAQSPAITVEHMTTADGAKPYGQ